jgi:acyl transferase domain-containing protein/acyl-CoA synthetase (AMP-forming)/AMP-acid ligase II
MSPTLGRETSLTRILELHSEKAPERVAYRAASSLEGTEESMTYAQLNDKAKAVAWRFHELKARGERAVLLFESGYEFVPVFLGCVLEGVIAVPAPLPTRTRTNQISHIVQDSGARFIVTSCKVERMLHKDVKRELRQSVREWITAEELGSHPPREYGATPSHGPAYLQYTSGTTTQPRGVMLSEANLLANCQSMVSMLPPRDDTVMVTWLPQYHDMGLVLGLMCPFCFGFPAVVMPPARFIQSPVSWLRAITKYRGTVGASPNFGYQLCVDKTAPEERESLDLSSWEWAICGAERIRYKTLREFSDLFESVGFQRDVFRPGYGLAEATLMVTVVGLGAPLNVKHLRNADLQSGVAREASGPNGLTFVSCGSPSPETRLVIADPETKIECASGRVGEIWVAGPGVGLGYWEKPEETEGAFGAHLAGEATGSFLRTGDLGLIADGELYVTGRIKDVIKIRARNYHSEDIEAAAQGNRAVGSGASFAVEVDGVEELVMVQELKRAYRGCDLSEVIRDLRQRVVEALGVSPHEIILVEPGGIAKTTSGKVRRQVCREQYMKDGLRIAARWKASTVEEPPKARDAQGKELSVQAYIVSRVAAMKGLDPASIDPDRPFAYYGVDSRESVVLSAHLQNVYRLELAPTILFDQPSIRSLARHLEERGAARLSLPPEANNVERVKTDQRIALIGIGCRFPGVEGPAEFWQAVRDGVDAIATVPTERVPFANLKRSLLGGFIQGINLFDAPFFNVSAAEAARMDPQQRHLLEVAWHALEDAGLQQDRLAGRNVGVFIGISNNDYARRVLSREEGKHPHALTGAALSIAANRLSYAFDWRGPSVSIDTACSSSLVATHLALQSLRAGECEVALAGGVNLILSPEVYDGFELSGALAPDGRCKSFDARADGFVRSEGVGIVILKPYDAAIRDGDHVYCVVLGSHINQDGRTNGLMAPSKTAQVELLRQAWKNAGVKPTDIQYLECHGSGTELGDAIEASALGEAMGMREANDRCWIGSVKSNFGHAESAAGIAGLIKTALALHHRELPPSLHCREPNPKVAWSQVGLQVVRTRTEWCQGRTGTRIAGVTSLGFGGSNAHVVLESCPAGLPEGSASCEPKQPELLTISARCPVALSTLAHRYASALRRTEACLRDLCFSAATFRTHHPRRLAVIASNPCDTEKELIAALTQQKPPVTYGQHRLAFVFSSGASHPPDIGFSSISKEPALRDTFAECDALLAQHGAPSVEDLLTSRDSDEFECPQLATFVLQLGLAAVWRAWGLRPDAVAGEGAGEIAAAVICGALNLGDGIRVIVSRSRLTKRICGKGGLLWVSSSEDEAAKIASGISDGVVVAIKSSPGTTVLAGDPGSLARLHAAFSSRGIASQPANVQFQPHSPAVDPLQNEFLEAVKDVAPKQALCPFYSSVRARLLSGPDLDAVYWWSNLRQQVLFGDNIREMSDDGIDTFVEVSGHPAVLSALSESVPKERTFLAVPSLRTGCDARESLLRSLGSLYVWGVTPDWKQIFRERGRRVPLPPYPFNRQSYWPDIQGEMKEGVVSTTSQLKIGTAVQPTIGEVEGSGGTVTRDRIINELQQILSKLLEQEASGIDPTRDLLELGADSIVMAAAVREIESRFNTKITIAQLFQTERTVMALADYIERVSPGVPVAIPPEPAKASKIPSLVAVQTPKESAQSALGKMNGRESIAEVLQEQLQAVKHIVSQQVHLLETLGVAPEAVRAKMQKLEHDELPAPKASGFLSTSHLQEFVPYKPVGKDDLVATPRQPHQEELRCRFTTKTELSRSLTQRYRPILADNRASAGFRMSIKELLYPIHADRSSGSRIWDLNGNEYIDLTMGFGSSLFGHNPPFVVEALRQQLEVGFPLGPQSPLAGEVAHLIGRLTGMERVTFCNSGTEAVMTAVRLARAVTGMQKIAIFAGSYHGMFDGVLAQRGPVEPDGLAMAPGIPPKAVEDVLVLEYGAPQALDHIARHASELAAVLVEPVQSRRPDLQPAAFLRALRELTRERGIALIWDEVITGFRIAPGGAQEWFGIQADLATYGKVVGGGLPIGVVAGSASFMNAIDGGPWNYGDDSFPSAPTTFFAGTFCKHPLTMAAANAVLRQLVSQGPALQRNLNCRTAELAQSMNEFFEREQAPIRVVNFGSLFRFNFSGNLDLFFYHLLDKGVYIWEGRTCFLSTAHTEADLEQVLNRVQEATHQIQEAGVIRKPADTRRAASTNDDQSVRNLQPQTHSRTAVSAEMAEEGRRGKERCVELSDAQKHLWTACQMDESAWAAYTLPGAVEVLGPLDLARLQRALERVTERHETLRMSLDPEGQRALIADSVSILLETEQARDEHSALEWLRQRAEITIDPQSTPTVRAGILKLGTERHILVINTHHLFLDGVSLGIVLKDIAKAYETDGSAGYLLLPRPVQFSDYAHRIRARHATPEGEQDLQYWIDQFRTTVAVSRFLQNGLHAEPQSRDCAQTTIAIPEALVLEFEKAARKHGCTNALLAYVAWVVVICRLSKQDDVVIGFPASGRSLEGGEGVVGPCVNVLPVRCKIPNTLGSVDAIRPVRDAAIAALDHDRVTLGEIVSRMRQTRMPTSLPLFNVAFNYDWATGDIKCADLTLRPLAVKAPGVMFELLLNVTGGSPSTIVDLTYNKDACGAEEAKQILEQYVAVMRELAGVGSAEPLRSRTVSPNCVGSVA